MNNVSFYLPLTHHFISYNGQNVIQSRVDLFSFLKNNLWFPCFYGICAYYIGKHTSVNKEAAYVCIGRDATD